jgi:hypothetical protein
MEQNEINLAEHVAGVIANTGTNSIKAAARAISYRIPVVDLAEVDAMAAEAGKSRNAMLNMFVSVGLDAVRRQLPSKVARSVRKRESECIAALLDGAEQVEE